MLLISLLCFISHHNNTISICHIWHSLNFPLLIYLDDKEALMKLIPVTANGILPGKVRFSYIVFIYVVFNNCLQVRLNVVEYFINMRDDHLIRLTEYRGALTRSSASLQAILNSDKIQSFEYIFLGPKGFSLFSFSLHTEYVERESIVLNVMHTA